jgi:trimeric autotransporter adhesin
MDRLSSFSFRRGLSSEATRGQPRGAGGVSRIVASLLAAVALTMGGVAVALASPGVASAVTNNPTPNPTAPAISYEEDCTTSLQAGEAAPYITALTGNTTVDNAAPTGATFGYTGTASAVVVGSFIAGLYAKGFGANPLSLQWDETIGSTDGNATGSYSFKSPTISEADGGGSVAKVTWAKNSTTLTAVSGTFADAAVGDYVYSSTAGLPTGVQITAINGANATIGAATTAAASKQLVGYGLTTTYTTPISTGDVFTTAGTDGETAGVGVTGAPTFVADGFITFGGATGDGASNCLQTGYTAAGTAGPGQTGGVTPPLETGPVFPTGTTTPLVSVSPLTFPSAAYVNLQSSTSAPGAPTIGTATAGNASATVSFTPPTNDGGSAITGYTVTAADSTTPANGGQTAGGTASPITVPGLTNGDSYTFTVTATNAIGTGDPSDASNAVTPEAPTAPGAPTIGTATAGNASASVTFTPPSGDGGSPITGYTVTAADSTTPANGGQTAAGTSSPITVPGLTNGDSYTFTVTATNGIGTGDPSDTSNAVTPEAPAVPGAPTIGTATAGNASATLTWTAPSDQGSSAITGYLITPSSGPTVTVGNVTSDDITGLTNGTAYTFTVSAINSVGTGDPSAPSNSVTPEAVVPGAPTIGRVTPGNASATVTFTAPSSDGGSPITGYTVTAADSTTPANGGQTASGTASPITVPGLTNGDSYTFTVAATNAIGTGDASAPSSPVTPAVPTAPGAPTIGTATAGNASATVTWTAPASNGGSPITGYVITPSTGSAVTVGNVTSDDVTGLTNGSSYTFTVAATNALGTGAASAASNAVTPEAPAPPPATPPGYWVVTADGGVYPQGSVSSHGSAASVDLNAPIVGSAALPGGNGYWLVGADGGIFSYGAAAFYGSMGGDRLNAPVVGMASTPDGKGYWLVAADGGVFAFGDAAFAGSAAQTHLNAPVVGIVGDGTTGGYWLVASDGGIFSYGNAHFYGSTGGDHLNAPIVGAAAAPGGNGYWLVGADGGVFAFGSAPFKGSAVGSTSGSPVVGISAATGGYVLTTADGGVFAYGAKFFGSEAGTTLGAPVVAVVN